MLLNHGKKLTQQEMKDFKGGQAFPAKFLYRCLIDPPTGYYQNICWSIDQDPAVPCNYADPCEVIGSCNYNDVCWYV